MRLPARSPIALVVLALGLALTACSSATEAPMLRGSVQLDSSAYHAGSTVRVQLENTGTSTWNTAPCGFRLQLQEGSAWQTVLTEPDPRSGCDASIVHVSPGQAATRSVKLSTSMTSGRYRVVVDGVPPELDEAFRTSSSFQILP